MAVRSYAQQKSALTRCSNKARAAVLASRNDRFADPVLAEAVKRAQALVIDECRRAVSEWNSREAPYVYGWPDDWSRWQRALDDVFPVFGAPLLEDL